MTDISPEQQFAARVVNERHGLPPGYTMMEEDAKQGFLLLPNLALDKIYERYNSLTAKKEYFAVVSGFFQDVIDAPQCIWDFDTVYTAADPDIRVDINGEQIPNEPGTLVMEEELSEADRRKLAGEKRAKLAQIAIDPLTKEKRYPTTVYVDKFTQFLLTHSRVTPYVEHTRISCDPMARRILGFLLWPLDGANLTTKESMIGWMMFTTQVQRMLSSVITMTAELRAMHGDAMAKHDKVRNDSLKPSVGEFMTPVADYNEFTSHVNVFYVEDALFGVPEEVKKKEESTLARMDAYNPSPAQRQMDDVTATAILQSRLAAIMMTLKENELQLFNQALADRCASNRRLHLYTGIVHDDSLVKDDESVRLAQAYGVALSNYQARQEDSTEEHSEMLKAEAKKAYDALMEHNKNHKVSNLTALTWDLADAYCKPDETDYMRKLGALIESGDNEEFTKLALAPLMPCLEGIEKLRIGQG